MGGAYEITTDGTTETVKKYYSIAGISVATVVTNRQGQVHDGTQKSIL